MKIRANDIDMHYELSGQGECLVLIHGYSDNLNMWYRQVPEFSKHCRVLTYDVRGFGQTGRRAADYSMGLFAEDLHALLGALKISKACVLGYSMGGRIGLEFTLRHPEAVRGLVFANSGVGGARTPEAEQRFQLMLDVLARGDIEAISEMMAVGSFSPGFKEKDRETFERYKAVKLQNDPSDYLAIMQSMMAGMATPPDLSLVQCPVLIIAGANDGFMPLEVAHAMQESIKNCVLTILASGHAAALECPQAFNQAVLDFVKGLS